MTEKKNSSGYVTWANFLVVLGLAITSLFGLNTFAWAMHQREQEQFEKRMVERFEGVGKRLDKIDRKLEK